MKNVCFIIGLFILLVLPLQSQDIPSEIYDKVEDYFQNQEDLQVDLSVLLDQLRVYYDDPLNINKVSYEDLQELRFLNSQQINDIIYHRNSLGDFLMVEELQVIPSLDVEDISILKSFIKVNDAAKLNISIPEMFKNSRHEVFLKWRTTVEDKQGFIADENSDPAYVGDKNKLFLRYRGNYENKLRYGFTIEKDEGEKLWSDTIYTGLDYVTAHIHLKDYSTFLKDLAIGDYSISLGQGLIEHSGFGAGKSSVIGDIKKGGRAIRPYNSVIENNYHRGIAATLRPSRNIEVTLFGSNVNRDGNLILDTLDNETPDLFFSSLQASGNHRTENERLDRGVVDVTAYGGILKYTSGAYNVAINHLTYSFSQPIIRQDIAANRFRFSGDRLSNTSIDYAYRFRNFHFYGESAISSAGGQAHLLGGLIGLHRNLNLSVHYRNYGPDYNALIPSAFGEGSQSNNENGFYFGANLRINRRWSVRGYVDLWHHPWLRSRVANPSDGREYLLRVDYFEKRKLSAYAQYFYEQKFENETQDVIDPNLSLGEIPKLNVGQLQSRHRLRLQFNNIVSKSLELRNRLEFSIFSDINGTSNGVLFYQDVIFKPFGSSFSMTGRVAIFDTDNFDSRIFAYENDLLYEFSIPSYRDRGIRYYINLRQDILRNLTGEFRIARTYLDRGSHGSGNEAIEGPYRTELKAQLRYTF